MADSRSANSNNGSANGNFNAANNNGKNDNGNSISIMSISYSSAHPPPPQFRRVPPSFPLLFVVSRLLLICPFFLLLLLPPTLMTNAFPTASSSPISPPAVIDSTQIVALLTATQSPRFATNNNNNNNGSSTVLLKLFMPTETADGTEVAPIEHPEFDINAQSIEEEPRPTHFEILSLDWHHVETPFTISVWILLASVAKILFHVHKEFGEAIPDSALLIVVGLVLGYGLQQLHVSYELYTLKSSTFFLYLLPPIIFDAGYFMPNRQLFENWDSVMLFAFVGTIWNTLAIGFTLYALGQFHLFSVQFTAFEILLFAALISAVDPVAVIAVFEEIHVNEFLFINVFGEALFNDGVSVVLYQMFRKFTLIGPANLSVADYLAGICSFVVIALGGTVIGVCFAIVGSLLTRFTSRVKILAPVFVFVVPYLAYLTADLFGMSAILAIVACGILMKQYVKGNLSHDANSSVKYFVKMLAQCSETAIFMFLGLSTISAKHEWDTAFVCITIGCCLLYRTVGVLVQCALLNRMRNKKFSYRDQFVLCYGGLRGAIAFGLVVSLPAAIVAKRMFVTTCIAVIYFTVFLMGITIRPLLYLLKVEKLDLDYEQMMVEAVYNKYCDYTMAGIEDIAGQRGRHFFRDTFERVNATLLKPILMRNVKKKTFDATDIVRAYNKITLQEALKIAHLGQKITKQTMKPHTQSIASAFREATMTNGGSGGTTTRSGGDGSTVVQRQNLEQFMARPENSDALYTLFSRLLDRKIDELRLLQAKTVDKNTSKEDDIKDNYMDILHTGNAGNTTVDATGGGNSARHRAVGKATADGMRKKSMTTPQLQQPIEGIGQQRHIRPTMFNQQQRHRQSEGGVPQHQRVTAGGGRAVEDEDEKQHHHQPEPHQHLSGSQRRRRSESELITFGMLAAHIGEGRRREQQRQAGGEQPEQQQHQRQQSIDEAAAAAAKIAEEKQRRQMTDDQADDGTRQARNDTPQKMMMVGETEEEEGKKQEVMAEQRINDDGKNCPTAS